jgi:hypothetical protein
MRPTARICFCSALLFLALCAPGRNACAAEDSVTVYLNGNSGIGLTVRSEPDKGPVWYLTREDGTMEPVGNMPEALGATVWQAEASPKETYLAVLSAEEGHPSIDVYLLEDLLKPVNVPGDESMVPVSHVNPYPGTIWITGWRNETLLEIISDVPLDRMAAEDPMESLWEPDTDTRTFLWGITTGAITKSPLPVNQFMAQISTEGIEFEDYSTRNAWSGNNHPPLLDTPFKRNFKAILTLASEMEPTFDGRYILASWGCGTECQQFAIIDAETGAVTEGLTTRWGLSFRIDSSLIIVNDPKTFLDETGGDELFLPDNFYTKYYRWDGEQLVLLKTLER